MSSRDLIAEARIMLAQYDGRNRHPGLAQSEHDLARVLRKAVAALEARQADEAALTDVILEKVEYPKMSEVRSVARAVVEFLGERHEPEPVAGPAYIDIMPPSPESNRIYWTMYCRECGVEEMMTDSADDPRLVAWRDEHNTEVHAPAAPQPSESDRIFLVDLIREHDLAADENTSPRDYRAGLALGIIAAGFSRAAVPAETEWRVDPDRNYVYWRDPIEGCWVAFKRADCVGEEELPALGGEGEVLRDISPHDEE